MAMDALARALALKFIKGKADLVGGKIPASELPSYVSEIVEVNTYADLPQPGQSNVIYVVKTPSVTTYRWTGSTYITVDEKAQYYSIEVDSSNVVTMGDLRTYVENVSNTGLHCFFDFSDFITNARTCTVLCFTQSAVNYCVIFDIINGRTYVDYSGYQDSETVQAYVNRLGDDIPRVISITDANTTVQDIVDLLNDVNVIGHHILFDFHTIQANCYLCSVSYSSNNIVITDIVGCKVGKATFDATTLLSTVLAGMGEIATKNEAFNVINASDIVNNTLTQAQYDLITNGKPTIILGTFANLINPILFSPRTNIAGVISRGLYVGHAPSGNQQFGTYQINEGTKLFNLSGQTQENIDLNCIGAVNNKTIPAYPTTNTSPQVLTIGANGGSLSWQDHMTEWYGTQAQYDALSSYDSNTIYNILES